MERQLSIMRDDGRMKREIDNRQTQASVYQEMIDLVQQLT
jgi:hypothetical protein